MARSQLLALGLARWEIEHRLRTGRLFPIHPGVYAVGRPPERLEARWMAAVLLGGPAAVLSHRSAAELWGLRRPSGGVIDVTAPAKRTGRPSVRFHRSAVPAEELTRRESIPVTGPFRTIIDLAAVASRHEVERALHECELAGLGDGMTFDDLLARHPRRPGAAALRAARKSLGAGAQVTRSVMEERFLEYLDERDLPRPQMNHRVEVSGGRVFEVDCAWLRQRVIVELDGRRFHDSDLSFERDRARARALAAAGWTVIGVTWRQIEADPDLETDLRAALAGPARPQAAD